MKKCKNCKIPFEPRFSTLEKFCWNTDCKLIEAMEKLSKIKKNQKLDDNIKWKEKKESLKTLQDYLQEYQKLVNTFIRLRDRSKRCISCNKPLKAKFDAGHFFSVGSYPSVRFDLTNIHGQCVHCNQHLRGNVHEYRKNITKRINHEELEQLEMKSQIPSRYMKHEIIELMEEMKNLIKKMRLN
jgi:hypothetical protein